MKWIAYLNDGKSWDNKVEIDADSFHTAVQQLHHRYGYDEVWALVHPDVDAEFISGQKHDREIALLEHKLLESEARINKLLNDDTHTNGCVGGSY